jgi:peptidoglycan/LPS O-acetylase OafA/YrhL
MNVLEHLLASMFYVHSLIYRAGSTINFVTWSLEVEIQFYLLAPLIAGVFLIRNSAWRRPLLLAGVIVPGILQMHAGPFQQLTIVFYIQYFLAGYLLCDLLPRDFHEVRRNFLWDVAAVVAWALIFDLSSGWITHAVLPMLIVTAYLGAFYGRVGNWVFRRPWIATIGGMCYSIYLTHYWVIAIFFRLTRHLNRFNDVLADYLLQIASLGTIILVFGAIYFVFIERPCMDPRWPNRLIEMWRGMRAKALPKPASLKVD